MTTIATAQCHVTTDIRANGREVRAAMERAAAAGARLVHFPEGALSGYPQRDDDGWDTFDWPTLHQELATTAEAAARLGLHIVLGASHPNRRPAWPHNSLHVITDQGRQLARYDKRLCSNTELTRFFTRGTDPVVFDVDGIRFGCALCIEVVFPHIFADYAAMGVDVILLSSFSQDPIHGVMAQAHAATQCTWLSLSTPVCCSLGLPTTLFGPNGVPIATARPGVPALLLHRIDKQCPDYTIALRYARPWRAQALSDVALSDATLSDVTLSDATLSDAALADAARATRPEAALRRTGPRTAPPAPPPAPSPPPRAPPSPPRPGSVA